MKTLVQTNEQLKVCTNILYDPRVLNGYVIATYIALCDFAADNIHNPSLERIAGVAHCNRFTVQRALKDLKNLGYIDIETIHPNKPSKYTILNFRYQPPQEQEEELPTVEQYRRLRDGSVVTEAEYQAMLKQPKRATGFGRGKRRY